MKHSVETTNHRQLKSKRTGEIFSLSAILSDLYQFKDVFIHHEIIQPNRKSSTPHAHPHREEMIYVLEGTPTAYLRGEACQLAPGDFIGFPPGDRNIHYIENCSAQKVRLLVIASNPPEDDVIYQDVPKP